MILRCEKIVLSECNFNPLDKMLELMEENKKLYERLLQEKDAMIAKLEVLVK